MLSKPDLKLLYDSSRRKLINETLASRFSIDISSGGGFAVGISNIPSGFNTQKANFVKVQSKASSNWEDLQTKYKTEKWQRIPLEVKKVSSDSFPGLL